MTLWQSGPLIDEHDVTAFDCAAPSLTQWLAGHARRAQRSGTARTYVWTPPESLRVVAYYSIAPTRVTREELSRSLAGGESAVPAYLLARLALDSSLHGQGLGGELLFDALDALVDAADRAGGRLIVVDAIDERAASFYQRYGFTPVKGNPHRLVIKVETVRQALNKPDPKVIPGGLAAVFAWLEAVRAEETSPVLWLLLDEPMRLALAQGWIMHRSETDPDIARRDRDDLAFALAPRDSRHPFVARMLTDLHHHWRDVYAGIAADFSVLHHVNPVGPDMELVVLAGPEHIGPVKAGVAIPAHRFITRLIGDTWVIAANAARLPQPGWPPTERT
jgi:GNAT superfamily N-acetyltransferase